MDASIIVCTYNRAESLKETLQALGAQHSHPDVNWEVIVVDNNSSDTTREVIEAACKTWPSFHYAFEAQQGLSHARNHGINKARGDILLFTDDDVLPEVDWLETTLAGMEKYQADACGGYIAPIWETPPPEWLTERFYGFLAVRTDRTDDYPITEPGQAPFGANMAFKRNVFQEVGVFDTGRGRKGKVLASGEDGELFERILAADLKAVFLGGSQVHHKVESFRLTKKYFRRWRLETSKNIAVNCGLPGDRRLFNVPVYLLPQLMRSILNTARKHISGPKDEAFQQEMIVCHFVGTIQGLIQSRNLNL